MSAELVRLGQQALAAMANSVAVGATLAECQLFASQFYEALRNELQVCPREDLVRQKMLIAALNQCDQTTITGTSPGAMLKELKSTTDSLQTGTPSADMQRVRSRPVLRVIEGGLS
jgi:thioredoxin-like negative regulator of GroEL